MKVISIEEARMIEEALGDVTGYLTDNSCSDPECCGGPYYTDEEYEKGVAILNWYGIEVEGT